MKLIVLYFCFIGRNIADRTQQMEEVNLTKVYSPIVGEYVLVQLINYK